MIDDDRRAMLTDIGMHPLSDQLHFDSDGNIPSSNSWPYKPAEELQLAGNVIVHTMEMDVYSVGTVIYAVSTQLYLFAGFTCHSRS
jgi:hypothetical protein